MERITSYGLTTASEVICWIFLESSLQSTYIFYLLVFVCKQTADFCLLSCTQVGAPKELLQNQEASLLRDIRDAINKRIQNRISTARRFAVSTVFEFFA